MDEKKDAIVNFTDRIMIFRKWISEINERLGLALELSEEGRLALQMDEGVLLGVEVDTEEDSYHLYSPLLELRSGSDLPVLAQALALNLYQKAVGGGAIGLDMENATLIYGLTQRMHSGSAELLASQLDQMPKVVLFLRERLSEARDPAAQLSKEDTALMEEEGTEESEFSFRTQGYEKI